LHEVTEGRITGKPIRGRRTLKGAAAVQQKTADDDEYLLH